MIVEPYRRAPLPPVVALLQPDGRAVDEHGDELDFDDWPAGTRLWAAYDTVYNLVREGHGEALCWRGEEIRWRHARLEDDWRRRTSDAAVVKLPFSTLPLRAQMLAFKKWRDWLSSFGASPTGTSGSAAFSLLRASLVRRLVTSSGAHPPLRATVGGRQELGPRGMGRFGPPLTHLDLPAAYAQTLAGLRYGGVWQREAEWEGWPADLPVFVRARVQVPDLEYGPLIRRPAVAPRSHLEAHLLSGWYPTGRRLQGIWTREELAGALAAGCRLLRILGVWVHRSGWLPFERWWQRVQEGREMGGLAGNLAKVTGNALWGRFCMDPSLGGDRRIRCANGGGRLVDRPLRAGRVQWPAHDLAETVSGRVRALLYEQMVRFGPALLCAHTDGLWVQAYAQKPWPWRAKDVARQIDVLEPAVLRYWPQPEHREEPFHVYAGVPAEHAASFFARRWEREGFA